MKKKITQQQEGTLFLLIISFIIWFLVGLYNSQLTSIQDWIGLVIASIILSIVTTLVVVLLFSIMKSWFNW